MANTTRGIPYPDDYTAAADVPAALQSIAATVDTLIGSVDTKATTATNSATSAATAASNAANAVATHTHSGSGSVNVGITAVTGLASALSAKSDTTHAHSQYAAATHTHQSTELAAHTHSEYAPSTHSHAQSQSHNSPDTDSSTSAIHHTLGIGPSQAAPGNHTHSGYADTNHIHNGYAASTHGHSEYSTTGHTHTGYANTFHAHTEYAASVHDHSLLTNLSLSTLYVSGAAADFPGVYSNATTGIDSIGITGSGRLRRLASTQAIKYDIASVTNAVACVDPERLTQVVTIDPERVLDVAVAEFSLIDEGAPTERRLLGFIADDILFKFPIAASTNTEGAPVGVLDTPILAALLAVVQTQQQTIADLTTRVTALESSTS